MLENTVVLLLGVSESFRMFLIETPATNHVRKRHGLHLQRPKKTKRKAVFEPLNPWHRPRSLNSESYLCTFITFRV